MPRNESHFPSVFCGRELIPLIIHYAYIDAAEMGN
jgi:hypothetical protein